MTATREMLARETKWALPVAIAAILAVLLVYLVPTFVVGQLVEGGEGDASFLRAIDGDPGTFSLAMGARALGYLLLIAPLVYLFRAAAARSDSVRTQLIGVLIAAPIFLAISAILTALVTIDAASTLVADGVTGSDDAANEAAQKLITETSLSAPSIGFELAGRLGFAVAMAYTAYQGMKIGLFTRFWGSLGAALGAVSFLFAEFSLLWFIYAALLIAGWVPGGRPPAWAAGEPVPWPKPGEDDDEDGPGGDDPPPPPEFLDVGETGPTGPTADGSDNGSGELPPAPAPSRGTGEQRKRKRRH